MASVHDHYRATGDTGIPDGVYRVVGTDDGTVTLLLVGDGYGERIHTGRTVRVPRDKLEQLKPAPDPDENRSPVDAVASVPGTAYWSVRAFLDQAASRPVLSSGAFGSVVFGFVGGEAGFLPDTASGVLILVGSLALAYAGGRL